mgnify:FL=1
MTDSGEGNVADVLSQGDARVHERWRDDFATVWELRADLEGLRLDALDGTATIPYWTICVVRLPALHRLQPHGRRCGGGGNSASAGIANRVHLHAQLDPVVGECLQCLHAEL